MAKTGWDLCVLGAGPAGYAAAMRAHDLGKRVLLVERDRVGGVGLHSGALSSKALWHLSNDYATARCTDRGYRAADIDVSYASVIDCVRRAVTERGDLLERQLERLSEPSKGGGVVALARGQARFLGPNEIEVTQADGSASLVHADQFLIATGSRPRTLPGVPVCGDVVVTSDHIEGWSEFPESMVIVGAGVVGCEYATIFANFGRTKIHIIDRQPRILPFEDEDVAEAVATSFEAMGVTIHRSSKLESFEVTGGKVEYIVTNADGRTERVRVDKALVSVGRVPNTGDLGLEAAGVALSPDGGVLVTATQTTAPHIWAAGDVTTDIALVNVAELEARYAVEKMFGRRPRPIVYDALSTIMFLEPEVASVGLNETQAKERGIDYRVGVVKNRLVPRNVAMRDTGGFVKLLARRGSGELLGLRVVGPQASSTIQGIAFLIHMGATLSDIDHCVHPHPAIPEGVQECARMLLGRSVWKPEVFGPEGLLRCSDG